MLMTGGFVKNEGGVVVRKPGTFRTLVLTLLLASAIGVSVSGCLLPVPVDGGGRGYRHHDRGRW